MARRKQLIIQGPLRKTFQYSRKYLELMRPRERNALMKSVLVRLANEWRWKFLKRRLQKKTVLNSPFNYKLDRRTPMIESGEMIKGIYKGKIYPSATLGSAKRGPTFRVKVALPTAHPVPREIRRVLTMLPLSEERYVARRAEEMMAAELRGLVQPKLRKNAKPRLELSPEQRKRMGQTLRGVRDRKALNAKRRARRRAAR